MQSGVNAGERASQAYQRAAQLVTEAHAWGFDIATWRAHLNALTWPEVLRQVALTAGWGARRCRPAKQLRAYDERALGDDVIEGDDGVSLTCRWPGRFHPNPAPGELTMKEACWKVLAALVSTEADVLAAKEGLPVREVAKRIEAAGHRAAKNATIVEGSVAGALSRDSLFAYVAPGVFALQVRALACSLTWSCYRWCVHVCIAARACAVGGHVLPQAQGAHRRGSAAAPEGHARGERRAVRRRHPRRRRRRGHRRAVAAARSRRGGGRGGGRRGRRRRAAPGVPPRAPCRHSPAIGTPPLWRSQSARRAVQGKRWVEVLAAAAYDALSLEERVEAVTDLMHLALDMPSARAALDRRSDELERAKKAIREAIKTERTAHLMKKEAKRDAAEARASAKAAAEASAAGEGADRCHA